MVKPTFTGKDLVAATSIIVLGVLIALGHDSALTVIFIGILSSYGLIRAIKR